ncbi:alpha/beta hydrolase [Mycobacterium manitobense]|uniref:Alpha/beta hydrolase n=1 Tax=[Mycobacterium] manitobense TaxID=190147 RepID=A0A9X3BU01_9MYCO|nr:alpha/beta hydrolase [[Mycobacterium] manitobense]MCV7168916.1 alpha/beta hydrolase [[Mycobacterium] manitobense]
MSATTVAADSSIRRRGSRRSRAAAAVSTVTLRQISAVLPPERAWGLRMSRWIIAGVMDAFGPSLAGAVVEPVDTVTADGRRVRGEWVRARGVARGDAAVYFLHGSGYALCSPRTHRRLTAWLSALTGLPVFCDDYRLAPRHRFPSAADDVRAGWDWLLDEQRFDPGRLVVAGDSAGGHLALDLLLTPEVAQRHPAAMVLFSPLFDLTFGLASERERLRPDPAIRAADAARLVRLYCPDTDPTDRRLAIGVAAGPALPRTLIQAGGAEMLAADAHRLADEIRAAGGDCELQVWPDQVHVFQALPRLSPEAVHAMRYAAGFIGSALRSRQIDTDTDADTEKVG